jgi:hypothetical protein
MEDRALWPGGMPGLLSGSYVVTFIKKVLSINAKNEALGVRHLFWNLMSGDGSLHTATRIFPASNFI